MVRALSASGITAWRIPKDLLSRINDPVSTSDAFKPVLKIKLDCGWRDKTDWTIYNGGGGNMAVINAKSYRSNWHIEQAQAQNEMDAMALKSIYVESALESQGIAVANLTQQYYALQAAMAGMPSGVASPIVTGPAAGFASGGSVPGVGNDDRIPAVLTPGEFVVKKDQASKHRGFLNALNAGVVKGFATGTRDIVGAHTGALRFGGYSDTVVPIGDLAASGQSASEALEAVTRSALGLAEGIALASVHKRSPRSNSGLAMLSLVAFLILLTSVLVTP